ncbi:Death domain-associated protein 6 [Araneus ventricosus]|uniref:Death domain-associated protein 6 n=1 Tax=Araneus ventricosus TaxID=182803 RepID=A0A4Y2ADX3_ARAVE|nr:Death domain-associated protein 6 [Araneus ventricosus]
MEKDPVEVITLLSSDEETPPLVNSLLNTKTDVKARKTARKSTTTSMSQLSITPIKPERSKTVTSQNSAFNIEKGKANASQSKLNSTSMIQSTFSVKKPMHESNNINTLNRSSNATNSVFDTEKNTMKPSVNGLPPMEITKKMPHLTITAIPKPSAPPVLRNSRTARKSVNSKSGRHSSPEVQITGTKLNKSPTYQNSAKLSERNQPVRVSTCSSKTAVHPSNSNKVTVNNSSYSNSMSNFCNVSEKGHGSMKDSLYVETLKKKARKSFPSSNSELPPSLISSLGKSGVSIINVNNTNSVNIGQVGKKSEEVFDPKSLKTSPDLSITKVKSDEVSIIKSSSDKMEHSGRIQVSQTSKALNNSRQLNTNSFTNNKIQASTIVKSKANEVPVSDAFFSRKNSGIPFRKVSKDNTKSSSLSRNSHMINTNEPSTGKCIPNNKCSSKNNSNLSKPQTRAQRSRNLNVKKSSLTGKSLADSESDVFILPDIIQTPATNQKSIGPVFGKSVLKPTLTKTNSSKNKQNVSVSDQLKKNQPLKRKNSNSVSSQKPSKKVSFETPPNGVSQNSPFVDHHKRIKAIKESLKDLNNDLKQQEKTDKSLDNAINASSTKKDVTIPLLSVGEKKDIIALPYVQEKIKDTIIPLPYTQEKKKDTIIPLPYNQEKKKKDTIIPLPCNQEKKKDTIIPFPCNQEKKKDTVIPVTYSEEKKNETIIPLPYSEQKKNDTVISLSHVEEKKIDTIICLPNVDEKNDTVTSLTNVEEKKNDTVIPLAHVEEKKNDTVIPLAHVEEKNDTVIPLAHVEEKVDTINPISHVEKDADIPLPYVDESIAKGIQMGSKEHESFDEVQNFEELSNETTNDGKYEAIILDVPPERPRKQVTSPKLSLKRKTTPDETPTDGTPVKKLKVSSEAAFEKICSPLQNQDKPTTASSSTFESVEVNTFPWDKDDDISTKYKKFLHFCKPSMKSSPQEENKIVKTFLKQFQKADVKFIESTNFIELLRKTVLKVKTNPGEIFVHLSTVSSRLREHKRLDFSSPVSSSNERSKSTNHVKQISSDEPKIASHLSSNELKVTENANHFEQSTNKDSEVASHLSSNELKVTESANHFEQSTSKDSEVASHLSSKESRVVGNAEGIEQNSCNEPERASHLSNDNSAVIDNANHSKKIPDNVPERASHLSNDNSAVIDNANHSKEIPDNVPEITFDLSNLDKSENFRPTNHTGQIAGDEPEIQSDLSNLNDKSEIVESTNRTETIPADEPEISTNFDDPVNDEYSPSLIASNPIEAIEPDDSRSSSNVFNPTVIESSVKGSCMNEFYSRPSTSKQADYVAMLLSSKLPGNTLEEIERESYRLPLDDLTKDSIENHQDYLISKKVANSIPHSELPIPTINPDIRDSHLEKGNDSDSTVSFPDKSSKSNPKKDIAPKHKRTDEEELERRIRYLENYLGKLDKKIKKLQLKELSLDDLDDDDSSYIREDKFKRKFNRVFTLLCELRKGSSRLGREIEKRFTYEGSRYEAINKAIEKLVNKRKAAEKFPNYKETLEKVREVNESHQIGLTSRDEERVAEQIFKDVGKELQRRRILDEEQDLISYCPDDAELDYDPADHDDSLNSKLKSSAAEAEKKIEEIMQKYVEMQKQEEKVDDDVMEVEETSDDEREDSDIPETEPATPSTDERMDEIEPEEEPLKEDLPAPISHHEDPDIIDIGSSSDASTEPGASASESRNSEVRPSLLTGGPPVFISDEIEVFEESNQGCGSSPDLPSLNTLFE